MGQKPIFHAVHWVWHINTVKILAKPFKAKIWSRQAATRNIYSTIAWSAQLYKDINPWVKAVLTLSTEITALDQPTTISSDVSNTSLYVFAFWELWTGQRTTKMSNVIEGKSPNQLSNPTHSPLTSTYSPLWLEMVSRALLTRAVWSCRTDRPHHPGLLLSHNGLVG